MGQLGSGAVFAGKVLRADGFGLSETPYGSSNTKAKSGSGRSAPASVRFRIDRFLTTCQHHRVQARHATSEISTMNTPKQPRIDLKLIGDWGNANFHLIAGLITAHMRWRSE